MRALFVDTSSLVKFYYPEKDSDRIEKIILGSEKIYLSGLSIVEMASALIKKVRLRELKKRQEMLIWNAFMADLQTREVGIIFPDEGHYHKAAGFIREFGEDYGLRSLDSLQLAVAHGLEKAVFLSSDSALSQVAEEIGMTVV